MIISRHPDFPVAEKPRAVHRRRANKTRTTTKRFRIVVIVFIITITIIVVVVVDGGAAGAALRLPFSNFENDRESNRHVRIRISRETKTHFRHRNY